MMNMLSTVWRPRTIRMRHVGRRTAHTTRAISPIEPTPSNWSCPMVASRSSRPSCAVPRCSASHASNRRHMGLLIRRQVKRNAKGDNYLDRSSANDDAKIQCCFLGLITVQILPPQPRFLSANAHLRSPPRAGFVVCGPDRAHAFHRILEANLGTCPPACVAAVAAPVEK